MVESLTVIVPVILWNLRPLMTPYEYSTIDAIDNEMKKVESLLNLICKRQDDNLVIKLCDALENANHHRWTYLKNLCRTNGYSVRGEIFDA